jgi:hypothetical protein
MKNLWIIVGLTGLGLVARADSLDDDLKNFAAAVKASDTAKSSTNPDMEYRMSSIVAQLTATASMPGGDANLQGTVTQLMATNSSLDVQKTGKILLEELAARRKARVDAVKAKVDELLARAPDVLAKAQKTTDLDGLLADLQKVQTTSGNYDQDTQAQLGRLSSAYQFVAQWQDYLSARNSGNIQAAQETLRNLLNYQRSGDALLVPRSEILARSVELAGPGKPATPGAAIAPATDMSAILDGIKTMDDLEAALKALHALPSNQGPEVATLSQYASLYAASKSGLPPSFELGPQSYMNPTLPPQFERIKAMVAINLLPGFIGESAPTPNPGETVAAYIDRATEAAISKQDWTSLKKIIEATAKINQTQQNSTGARSFLAGLSQEMAGQYAQAVASYQSVLRDPDDSVPIKVVGDRLAAIKKDHPADYDEGMKPAPMSAYANPMMMRAMMGYPGLNSNYPPGVMPGMPVRTAPPVATNAPPAAPAVTPAPPIK